MADESVTFTLSGGTKVTCSKTLADKIRKESTESKAPAKKTASSKSEK